MLPPVRILFLPVRLRRTTVCFLIAAFGSTSQSSALVPKAPAVLERIRIFSNIFKRFRMFSNVLFLPVLPNRYSLTHQPPFLSQKSTSLLKSTPKNHHFSIILDNSSLQFLSASGGIAISIDRKQPKESPA